MEVPTEHTLVLQLSTLTQRELLYLLPFLQGDVNAYFKDAVHASVEALGAMEEDLPDITALAPQVSPADARVRDLILRAQSAANSILKKDLPRVTDPQKHWQQTSVYVGVTKLRGESTHSPWRAQVTLPYILRDVYQRKHSMFVGNYATEFRAAQVAHAARKIITEEAHAQALLTGTPVRKPRTQKPKVQQKEAQR